MASFTFNSLQQKHLLLSATLCKYPPTLNLFGYHYSSTSFKFSPPNFKPELPPISVVKENVRPMVSKLSTIEVEPSTGTVNSKTLAKTDNGFPSLSCEGENLGKKYASSVAEDKDVNRRNLGFRKRREIINGKFNVRSKDKIVASKSLESVDRIVVNKKTDTGTKQVIEEKKGKESKKNKVDSTEVKFRVQLDMCSKRGDVIGAIQFYDKAVKEGIKMGQYHYTVLLYLCSSAAVGIVRPAKSGKSSRSLDMLDTSNEVSRENNHMGSTDSGELASKEWDGKDMHEPDSDSETLIGTGRSSNRFDDIDDAFNEKEKLTSFSNGFVKRNSRLLDGLVYLQKYDLGVKDGNNNHEDDRIWADENAKKYALQRGFEIYEKMCLDNIPMNEAALTSVARMAMSMGNGDMAFDMVKQMKVLGINPRLRSYGPSLSAFCNCGNVEKAFAVEQHMLQNGVYPEEPELAALLRVSIAAGKGDKVYYLLHKLRTTVRKVSPSTAELIVNWFNSKAASSVGKTKWDQSLIKEAIENGGGGWHGQGWLRRGKWSVLHTTIGADGMCKCCGDKLATIDLDPKETEEFAESVASIAIKREKNSNFQKFQKWLDYYGPFEAVVDAANVGLFGQKRFVPSKVNAVVNGIRQKLPSKKWPLIVLHNKRVTGQKMDEPVNKALIDKWRNADALYTTPTGSNDDWYWLYAAIKFKCLIVTNDEMRDHVFQLLGNDFFPKWKERHQVHFTFSNAGPVFHMPPPYSVVIQESEKGHWHIPILSEHDYEAKRPWLCVMRAKSRAQIQDFETKTEGSVMMQTKTKSQANPKTTSYKPQEIYMNFKDILSGSTLSNHHSILKEIETAEKIGSCIIDFQI